MLGALTPPRCMAPALEALTPATGSTAGGTQLIVRGQNFLPGATLLIDGLAATDVVVSSRAQLLAKRPAHLGAFGIVPVVLTNFDAQTARRGDLFASHASQFSFGAMTSLATAQSPTGLVGADFDRDGRIDLASSNGQSSVSIFLGDGMGGFGAAKTTNTGPNAVSLAAGDFNTDTTPDLTVVTYGSNNVQNLLGDGAGGFPIITDLPGVGIPGRVTVADIDGDGDEDLLVPSGYSNTAHVFSGNAKGGFTGPTSLPVGSSPGSVAVGDWNGDKRRDLAVSNYYGHDLSVMINQSK